MSQDEGRERVTRWIADFDGMGECLGSQWEKYLKMADKIDRLRTPTASKDEGRERETRCVVVWHEKGMSGLAFPPRGTWMPPGAPEGDDVYRLPTRAECEAFVADAMAEGPATRYEILDLRTPTPHRSENRDSRRRMSTRDDDRYGGDAAMSQDEGRERFLREELRLAYLQGFDDGKGRPEDAEPREPRYDNAGAILGTLDRLRTPTAEPSEPVKEVYKRMNDLYTTGVTLDDDRWRLAMNDMARVVYAHPVPEDFESVEVERLKAENEDLRGVIAEYGDDPDYARSRFREIDLLKDQRAHDRLKIQGFEAKNEKLRAALGFYADIDNYKVGGGQSLLGTLSIHMGNVATDGGKCARDALNRETDR